MADLPPPMEILGLGEDESASFRVLAFEEGEALIRPTFAPATVRLNVLRLFVPPEDKPAGAPYWDLTTQTTVARLRPLLQGIVERQERVTVHRQGAGKAARDTVTVSPS